MADGRTCSVSCGTRRASPFPVEGITVLTNRDDRTHSSSQSTGAPVRGRAMWRLLNTPRPVDPGFMRVGCAIFLVIYVIITFVRYEESHQPFFWLRLLVCGYAALGI